MALKGYSDRMERPAAGHDGEACEVRVLRTWDGGPPRGAVFRPPAARAEQLLRLGMVERVDGEAVKPAAKRKSRHAAANG